MFAPVICSECGKRFAVERAYLGQHTSCPYCLAAKAQPLPLPEPVDPPVRRFRKWPAIAVVALCIVIAGGTFLVQRYRNGAMPPFVMQTFVATDQSCQATLPGSAAAVDGPEFTPLQTGAALYASESTFTRIRGGLGWIDLDTERAKLVRTEDLLGTVRDELGRWLGEPTIEKEGLVKSGTSDGMEVRFGTGTTRFTARILAVLDSTRPRIYLVWVGGPHFKSDGEVSARVLTSFRVNPSTK